MKKIFKCLGLFCLSVAVAIGSFFVTKKETKTHIASADNVNTDYTFYGSSVLTPVWRNNSDNNLFSDYVNFRFTLSKNSDNSIRVDLSNTFGFIQTDEVSLSDTQTANFLFMEYISLNNSRPNLVNFVDVSSERTDLTLYYDYTSRSTWLGAYNFYIIKSGNFDCNVSFVHLYSTIVNSISYNVISYVDYNNNSLSFYFPFFSQRLVFSDRIYYVNQNLDDNQLYNQGYQQGLADNQQVIYNEGYNAGRIVGYNNGKTDGIASANNYSFIGLIGAVFDAPLQTFKGLLNFNVLGINLLDFALSLITIALVVYIIRLIKGGR